jgi:hypothetical protein
MQTVTTQESRGQGVQGQGVQQHRYRGRVRSGCLTCRSRKVKCDEMRPMCNNCMRLKRRCVYRPKKSQQRSVTGLNPGNAALNDSVRSSGTGQLPEADSVSQTYPSPLGEEPNCVLSETFRLDSDIDIAWGAVRDAFLSADNSIIDVTARLENALRHQNEASTTAEDTAFDVASPSTLISRDIELTTTMDILAAREAPFQSWFLFFIEAVDCPSITPYDALNWQRMKLAVVNLGMSNGAIASAVIAVSVLYKGQLYSLPLSKALSLYNSSKRAYESLLNDKTLDFGTILAATFLLCLFEFIHYETAPSLIDPSEIFIKRLETWAQHKLSHSELSSRIIAWLRLLHATTMRGGSIGLVSDSVCSLFPDYERIPNLRSPPSNQSDASTHLYEMLSTPIFEFYFQIQIISGEIAKLTHYRRSRITGVDQEETVQQISQIKSRLQALWAGPSSTQCHISEDLRSHLAPNIANPIITLIGVCTAAYYAEFVEMDRLLGDPVSESIDSKHAMRRIREIVDGDWNAYNQGKLNSGYLRPLFLYAIECMDRDENQWAVERLEQIKNPICRSEFFASFAKALSDAQQREKRRVTSRYFCVRYFGVAPPFI